MEKRTTNRRDLKTPALQLSMDGKHFVISLTEFFSNKKWKVTDDCCVLKYLQCHVDGEHLMPLHMFQSENAVFEFLLCSVDLTSKKKKKALKFSTQIFLPII